MKNIVRSDNDTDTDYQAVSGVFFMALQFYWTADRGAENQNKKSVREIRDCSALSLVKFVISRDDNQR